jgi:hypothetical protein
LLVRIPLGSTDDFGYDPAYVPEPGSVAQIVFLAQPWLVLSEVTEHGLKIITEGNGHVG